MRYWVYILECSDGRYYTGTYRGDDPAIRASEHNTGKYPDAWTAKHLPVKLVWCSEYQRITDAIEFEQRIKRWSRAKKEAVIRGEWANSPNSPKPIPGASLKSCRTAGEPALVVRRTRASLAAHHEGYLATSTCRSPARKARSHRLAVLSLHRRGIRKPAPRHLSHLDFHIDIR